MVERVQVRGVRSSARLSWRTFTPRSPRMPRSRPSVFRPINSRTLSSLTPRALATRGTWSWALRQADVRIESAAGSGHGIGGNLLVCAQAVFCPVGFDAIFDCVLQLLRSWSQVAAAGIRGVVAVAGGGRPRMKIFRGGESLRKQRRATDFPGLIDNQNCRWPCREKNACETPKTMSG